MFSSNQQPTGPPTGPQALGNLPTTIEAALQPSSEARIITEPAEPFRIVHVNEAWCRTCGFDAEEVLGHTCKFMHGPGTCPATLAMLKQALQLKRNLAVQLLNYTKSGRPFMNTLQVAPLTNRAGQVTHYLGVVMARYLDGGGPVPPAAQQAGHPAPSPLLSAPGGAAGRLGSDVSTIPANAGSGDYAASAHGLMLGGGGRSFSCSSTLAASGGGGGGGGSVNAGSSSMDSGGGSIDSSALALEYTGGLGGLDDDSPGAWRVPPFLTKLTEILTAEPPEVVTLNAHAPSFTIFDPQRFAKEVRRAEALSPRAAREGAPRPPSPAPPSPLVFPPPPARLPPLALTRSPPPLATSSRRCSLATSSTTSWAPFRSSCTRTASAGWGRRWRRPTRRSSSATTASPARPRSLRSGSARAGPSPSAPRPRTRASGGSDTPSGRAAPTAAGTGGSAATV